LKRAEALLENNRIQVEVGTLAPIEVVRAQAEVARSRQALTNSESLVMQQEVILKNFLSRRGTEDEEIRGTRLVPVDSIQVPDQDTAPPLQQLIEQAFRDRPDFAQAQIQLENARIALKGSKNALLPQLDLVGTLQNNALAGEVNALPPPGTAAGAAFVRAPDPQFLGGYGTALAQIFRRNYPDYGLFVQLNIPLSNSQARADMMRDAAQLGQAEMRLEQLKHQVRTDVEAALIALQRARAAYDTARQARLLQEDVLQAEEEKYSVGATTSFFLIQYQRDLVQARSDEVLSQSLYAKSQTALERAVGQVLSRHNIVLDEAYAGQVKRPPRALPPAP
jgi:outer membrane protein